MLRIRQTNGESNTLMVGYEFLRAMIVRTSSESSQTIGKQHSKSNPKPPKMVMTKNLNLMVNVVVGFNQIKVTMN